MNMISGLSDNHQWFKARIDGAAPETISEEHLLTMALSLAQPRSDATALSTKLLEVFGSYAEAVSADQQRLADAGVSEGAILALKLVRESALRLVRPKMREGTIISAWSELLDYCTARMAYDETESFRLIYMDRKNRLIADEAQQKGTVDHTPVYPREVAKRALQLNASSAIMVHNHPSGDPTPSRADIDMTRKVQDALGAIGVTLHDHVVVSRGGHISFRTQGLL